MSEPVIVCSHVGKKFARSLRRAMWYGLADIARVAFIPARFRSERLPARLADAERAAEPEAPPLRPSEFWALKDVNFSIGRGECVGVVGTNGSGKSTLFSIISGIYGPSRGQVEVRGRLQALIALGAGFHPLLSGRENIYINASILGMTTAHISRMLPAIIDFAELGEFIDMPIKNYSSGMLVRLGFSIAAHLDPDILLIDEVLAVGDGRFQMKCQRFTRRLADEGKSVLLVSHALHNIQGMCSRAIWLQRGVQMADGDVHAVTASYQRFLQEQAPPPDADAAAPAAPLLHVDAIEFLDDAGRRCAEIDSGDPLRVRVRVTASEPIPCARFYVCLVSAQQQQRVAQASMFEDGFGMTLAPGAHEIEVRFDALPFEVGAYLVYANARSEQGVAMLSAGLTSTPVQVRPSPPLCANGAGRLGRIRDITPSPCKIAYRWISPVRFGEGS